MSKKISISLCINRLNSGKEKLKTREQIETAKDVSKYAEEYIRKWLKENTELSDIEIDKQIIQ